MSKRITNQSPTSNSTRLLPETINQLSKFVDCMQLIHPAIIAELADPSTIQQVGHELYDRVVQLRREGKIK